MPELPEVETIKKQLNELVPGYQIKDIWFDNPKSLQPTPEVFIDGVKSRIIEKIERHGKILIFCLRGSNVFVVHFKLTGRLLVRKVTDLSDEYVHVILRLEASQASSLKPPASKIELRFADARKFGFMRLLQKGELTRFLTEFGPEPLDDLTREKFREILAGTSRKVKEVLMDQKAISGIGNIYANEALWLAKAHPETPADRLSQKQMIELFDSIEKVLKEGLKTGGASDEWYLDAFGAKGKYQEHFKVYGRVGLPCLRCRTPIQRIAVGQRGSFYCPKCQDG